MSSTSVAAAADLGRVLTARGWSMATVESLTGGLIAASCTRVPGASDWYGGGLVTYTAAMKHQLAGVPLALIERYGVVSEPVARAMAEAGCRLTGADLGLAVTGIAGPGGGEILQPVGTVWFAWVQPGAAMSTQVQQFSGDRDAVRAATVEWALSGALALLAH